MERHLAYVCCGGKKYLDRLLRSECQVYEFKEVHAFKNLAVDRMTWEQISFVARSWRQALLGGQLSQVSAAQCGRQNWALWQPSLSEGPPKGRGKKGAGENKEAKTPVRVFCRAVAAKGRCLCSTWLPSHRTAGLALPFPDLTPSWASDWFV